jgi:hypothetical protein
LQWTCCEKVSLRTSRGVRATDVQAPVQLEDAVVFGPRSKVQRSVMQAVDILKSSEMRGVKSWI